MAEEPLKKMEQTMAEALWKTVFYYWQNPEDRSEAVMIHPVVTANGLLRCLAYTISQMNDPKERRRVLQEMGPSVDKMIEIYRREAKAKGHALIIPEDSPRIH